MIEIKDAAKRAINFDLDTNQMLILLGSKTKGYSILKKEFKKLGFEHRQGCRFIQSPEWSNLTRGLHVA